MKDLKIVFMGTPSFAANVLEGILSKYSVSLVVCQPDNERNRKARKRKINKKNYTNNKLFVKT